MGKREIKKLMGKIEENDGSQKLREAARLEGKKKKLGQVMLRNSGIFNRRVSMRKSSQMSIKIRKCIFTPIP